MASALVLTPPSVTVLVSATTRLAGALREAAAGAIRVEHERIMTTAKRRTPVDTGALRASGHVQPTRVEAGGRLVSVGGFGGPAAPYAVVVHEDLTARHPVGQAKFYETSVLEAQRDMAERLAAHIRRHMTT
jgi:hypothetical protein